jgi:hypothetical protein
MKHEDVKIGMKVVPHSKSVWGWSNGNFLDSFHLTHARERSQPYLFITGYDNDERAWMLSHLNDKGGDFFLASDFEPYEEEPETKKPVLLDEESNIRKFVIEKVYRRYDINFEYLPLEYRLKENDKEILDRSYLQDDGEFVGFFKALDYLGVKYEVLNRKINEGF